MSKKGRKKYTKSKKSPDPKKQASVHDEPLRRQSLTRVQLALLVLGTALAYWIFSFFSTGMYQGEEAIHYLNMREFWYEPSKILGNWGKPGWKLIYILPSLLGYKFLFVVNSLVSALAGYVAYRVAQQQGVKVPWLAILILFSQFFWFHMAFRNYSELISSVLLLGAIYMHYKDKHLFAGLLLSYLLIIRQEWGPLVALYGLYLLYKRQWLAAFSLGLFPLFINIWGFFHTGQPFYFIENALSTSEGYGDRYPRQGFDHYFKVALPIFGPLSILGLTAYFTSLYKKSNRAHVMMIVPVVAFFLLVSVLNIQSYRIGTSTAGNWRYLLVICPIVAVLATIGYQRMILAKKKLPYYITGTLVALLIAGYSGYKHNYIGPYPDRDYILIGTVILALAAYLLPIRQMKKIYLLAGMAVVLNVMYIRPKLMIGENLAIKNFIPWTLEQNVLDNHILLRNNMLLYFWNKTSYDFENGFEYLSPESLEAAPVGAIIFWDSHYSEPYGKVPYQSLQDNPDKYKLLQQVVSDDKRFVLLTYQKIAM